MVSKASEDLPDPDRPVNTTSESRGRSTSIFFRLCSRAPRIAMMRRSDAGRDGFLFESNRSFMLPVFGDQEVRRRIRTNGRLSGIVVNIVRTALLRQPRHARSGRLGTNRLHFRAMVASVAPN
jgi:hypothetical protein